MKRVLLGLIFFMAAALTGCTSSKVDGALAKVVEDYCWMKQEVYANPECNNLSLIATCNEMQNLFPVVQGLKCSDSIMRTQVNCTVNRTKISRSGGEATVTTRECWNYWWEEKNTGKITKDRKVENYCMEYDLVKENGIWKVDRVRNLSSL